MSEVAGSRSLGFRREAGLGSDSPLVRGVVGLRRRLDEHAGDYSSYDTAAKQLSRSMQGSILIAAVDLGKPWQPPVASVISHEGLKTGWRRTLEIDNILVDPSYKDPSVLASVMIALSCRGRNRFRPISASVNPAHESTVEALGQLGFQKDEEMSGIEIYVGVPPEDGYTLSAGQLAIHRAERLPGVGDLLGQARQNFSRA